MVVSKSREVVHAFNLNSKPQCKSQLNSKGSLCTMPLRGTHKLDEFEIVEVIGSGQYGVCKKVRKKSDGKVIVL